MSKESFRWRALIAFLVTWAFAVATVTGIVLYVVPQGRIAFWTDWRLIGLGKEDWGNIHMVFGGIFIVTGALHLYFNWKPFKSYLADRIAGQVRLRREMVVSLVVSFLVLGAAVGQVPPVSWVFDLNDDIKAIWADAPGAEPPFGHAEEVSLAGFFRRQGIDPEAGHAALAERGWAVSAPKQSLKAIARAHGVTPADLYVALKPLETPRGRGPGRGGAGGGAPTSPSGPSLTVVEVEAQFAGTGLGRKTLAQVCADAGVGVDAARKRLAAAGITIPDGVKFKEVADDIDATPIDLLKVILVEGYRP